MLKIIILHEPALLLRIYHRELLTYVYQGTFTRIFIAAEFLTREKLEITQMPTDMRSG